MFVLICFAGLQMSHWSDVDETEIRFVDHVPVGTVDLQKLPLENIVWNYKAAEYLVEVSTGDSYSNVRMMHSEKKDVALMMRRHVHRVVAIGLDAMIVMHKRFVSLVNVLLPHLPACPGNCNSRSPFQNVESSAVQASYCHLDYLL